MGNPYICEESTLSPAPTMVEETSNSVSTISQSERSTPSNSESVRERLRQQEAKINALMKNNQRDTSDTIMMRMIKNLENDLKKTEAEKEELEAKVEILQKSGVNNTYASIDSTFDQELVETKQLLTKAKQQVAEFKEKHQSASIELFRKSRQIELQREMLEEKNRKIVDLQVDLESHSIHYTSYSDDQFRLGREALVELNRASKSDHGDTRKAGKRAKKLISKLLSDLEMMESRYKDEKMAHSRLKTVSEEETQKLKDQIAALEKQLQDAGSSQNLASETVLTSQQLSQESLGTRPSQEDPVLLQRKVETLEYKLMDMRKTMKQMDDLSEFSAMRSRSEREKSQLEKERQQLENKVLVERIQALEAEHPESEKSQFDEIQKRIETNYDVISKLQQSNEIKTRQNEELRKELAEFKATLLSQEDFSVLTANTNKESQVSENDAMERPGVSSSEVQAGQVADLKAQVHELRAELARKEKELILEKTRSTLEKEKLTTLIRDLDPEADLNVQEESHRLHS